jgi:hypothetical protein
VIRRISPDLLGAPKQLFTKAAPAGFYRIDASTTGPPAGQPVPATAV